MALASLAIRLSALMALKGATLCGDRVSDSSIAPLDQRAKVERQPAMVIYTDDLVVDQLDGRDLLTGQRSLQLTIEIVVADQVDREGETLVTIPETDEGLELTLGLIERQVLRVLQAGEDGWSEIFRSLFVKVRKYDSQRGAGLKDGVRFAARQLVLTLQPLAEPDFGRPADGVWALFLHQLGMEPGFAPLVPILEAEIHGAPLADWSQAQALLGLTLEGVTGIGLAPIHEPLDPREDGAQLGRVTIVDDVGQTIVEPDPED